MSKDIKQLNNNVNLAMYIIGNYKEDMWTNSSCWSKSHIKFHGLHFNNLNVLYVTLSGLICELVTDFPDYRKTYKICLFVLCMIDINIYKFAFVVHAMAYENKLLKHEPRPKEIIRITQWLYKTIKLYISNKEKNYLARKKILILNEK